MAASNITESEQVHLERERLLQCVKNMMQRADKLNPSLPEHILHKQRILEELQQVEEGLKGALPQQLLLSQQQLNSVDAQLPPPLKQMKPLNLDSSAADEDAKSGTCEQLQQQQQLTVGDRVDQIIMDVLNSATTSSSTSSAPMDFSDGWNMDEADDYDKMMEEEEKKVEKYASMTSEEAEQMDRENSTFSTIPPAPTNIAQVQQSETWVDIYYDLVPMGNNANVLQLVPRDDGHRLRDALTDDDGSRLRQAIACTSAFLDPSNRCKECQDGRPCSKIDQD